MLINNHQSLKAEIDAREENFAICINLGKALLERNHYRSDEVSTCIKSLYLLVHCRLNSLLLILSLGKHLDLNCVCVFKGEREADTADNGETGHDRPVGRPMGAPQAQ